MLNITTKNEHGQEETFDVATEFHAFMQKSAERGKRMSPFGLRAGEMKKETAEVRLHAVSDVGKGLLALIENNESLYDVCVIDEAVMGVREELRDEIEQNLLYGQYMSVQDLFKDIKEQTKALAPVKMSFYCPLSAYINDPDDEYCDADNDVLVRNQELIAGGIADEQARELRMGEYVGEHAGIAGKVIFAEWDVEEINGTLYGRIDCYLSEELGEDEIDRLKDAITGQNSDGLGEGFEQREIYIDEGDLYVSYWNNGEDYFLHTQEEMDEYIAESSGMSYGGLT